MDLPSLRETQGFPPQRQGQLLRASQAVPLNLAEGTGKASEADRRRFFEIARGSALECAAIQDVLEVCGALTPEENAEAKRLLDRIVTMLTKLGGRGYAVREEEGEYGRGKEEDSDSDSDTDSDGDGDSDVGQGTRT